MSFQVVPFQVGKYYNMNWNKTTAEVVIIKDDTSMCDLCSRAPAPECKFKLFSRIKYMGFNSP
jgi:hypothetical protein